MTLPRDSRPDSTLAIARRPYTFISEECQRHHSDVFETRLLLQPFTCMRGEEAARLFYDTSRFRRSGVAPGRVQKTLFGQGGVQGLDGEVHKRRKAMFMSLMTREKIQRLVQITEGAWREAAARWERQDEVVLFYEVRELLCRAVCTWAGVPLLESEVKRRTDDFGAMIDGAGGAGPRHWRGRRARQRANWWIEAVIAEVRARRLEPPEGSALAVVSWHRDLSGALLEGRVAAVELINVLRPVVAVDRYIAFTALALFEHPESWAGLGAEADGLEFVQEVRRVYPFFPFVAAQVKRDFEWRGYPFPAGRKVLLDLYGTNHDERIWVEPEAFRPERFRTWDGSAYNFIPQGGGDHFQNHRCAGEWITIALMKGALNFLTGSLRYKVPEQDLSVSLSRLPAAPKSRFVIREVRRV